MSSAATPAHVQAGAGRKLHLGAVFVFLVLVFVQIYLAGRGVFGQSSYDAHKTVGGIAHLLTLLLLIATIGIPATRNRVDIGMAAGLFVLVTIQAIIGDFKHPAIAAFHPLNALLILGLAFHMLTRDRQALTSG